MKANDSKKAIEPIYLFIFVLVGLLSTFVVFDTYNFVDFRGQWAICAYGIRGIDPYPLVGNSSAMIESIGTIPKYWGTSPWGILLGNLFYAGFLNRQDATLYFYAVNFIVLAITIFVVTRFIKRDSLPKNGAIIIAAILMLVSADFWASVAQGNIGGIICCMCIIACALSDKNSIISGICLGIAMIKPQVALIFCFFMLLQKTLKPVFVAAGVDIIAYGVVSIMYKKSPIVLLKEFLGAGIGADDRILGYFSLLRDLFGVNDNVVMVLSMALGVFIVFLLQRKINPNASTLVKCIPALVVSNCWSYTWWNDQFVNIIPALVSVCFLLVAKSNKQKLMWFASAFIFSFKASITILIRSMLLGFAEQGLIPATADAMAIGWHIENTVYCVLVTAFCVLIINEINKRLLNKRPE